MHPQDAFDREYDRLVDMVNNGEISDAEFRAETGALRQEYRAMAEEAAQAAYDDVMTRW